MTPDEFVETLDDWTMRGGEFPSDKIDRHYLTTVEEADAVVRALANGDLMYCKSQLRSPNLFAVAGFVQSTFSPAVDKVFRRHALPHLNEILAAGLAEDFSAIQNESDSRESYALKSRADTYFFVLKVASYYGDKLDSQLLIKAARHPYFSRDWVWSSIFDYTERNNPQAVAILEALRSPLPNHFCRIAYLDFANRLAFDQRIKTHPFDTDESCEFLLTKFDYDDSSYDSYAISAIAAAPFLAAARRERVLAEARAHSRTILHREAVWAEARASYPGSVDFLLAAAMKPQTATRALRYLKAMCVEAPTPANPAEFQALQKASDWLSAEDDLWGHAPDEVFVIDHRTLRLPPHGETLPAWLIGFRTVLEGEQRDGYAVIMGEGISRYGTDDNQVRLSAAYVSTVRHEPVAYEHYGSRWHEDEFWQNLLLEFNPNLDS